MIVMLQLVAGLVGFGIIICMRNQQAKVKAALAEGRKGDFSGRAEGRL